MEKYRVRWRYFSSLGGAWQKGDIVELDTATAKAINVDSPGVLELVTKERQQASVEDRQLKNPPAARSLKGRKNQ